MSIAPDWNDLRYFVHAARTLSLAGAARALGVNHATVGRRLTALERALGAALFVRTAAGLQLTPLAIELLPLAEEAERAMRAVAERAATHKTRVRLAVPSGFATLFAPHLARVQQRHPLLVLDILSGSRAVDLAKAEAELALRSGPVTDPDLVARRLGTSGWSLYASDAYLARHGAPTDLDDLAGHELIGYDSALAAVPAAQWVEQRAVRARIVLRAREMTEMLAAAASGAGLALLPCLLGDEEPRLRRLTPQVLATRDIWLAYRREAAQSDAVRAVIDFVVEVVQAQAARVAGSQNAPA